MSDDVKAMPTELVRQVQAVLRYLIDRVVAAKTPGLSVPTQVDEDVGEHITVEVGKHWLVRGVVGVPVVHDQHGLRSRSMLSEAQTLANAVCELIVLIHLKLLLVGLQGQKDRPRGGAKALEMTHHQLHFATAVNIALVAS